MRQLMLKTLWEQLYAFIIGMLIGFLLTCLGLFALIETLIF